MDLQTLNDANAINANLSILAATGASVQAIIDDESKSQAERLAFISTAYAQLYATLTDSDTQDALALTVADYGTSFITAIDDSIDQLNTALTALCQQ